MATIVTLEPQFPLLSALAELGLTAVIRDGKLGLIPPERVTPHALATARRLQPQLIEEITRRAQISAEDRAADCSFVVSYEQRRWHDDDANRRAGKPCHNPDAISAVLAELFAQCARRGFQYSQYWDGDPATKPPDTARPYCYLRDVLVDGHWQYWPILADVDGTDYVWADVYENAMKQDGVDKWAPV